MNTMLRLDQFVAAHFSLSRSQAAKLIEQGRIKCNGAVAHKVAMRVQPDDVITLEEATINQTKNEQRLPAEALAKAGKTNNVGDIPLLYEDSTCLVINKPQDIAVAPLLEQLQSELGIPSLFLAHRLDKGTTGCLLLAKSEKSCEALQKQFQERTVSKKYLAVVSGVPKESEATIEAPVGRNLMDRKKMSLFRTSKSRSASTHYRILSKSAEAALLQCTIHTGRTHQIRVHLRAIGHPIVGDETYGNEQSQALSRKYGITLPCLHAEMLSFRSPKTLKIVEVVAPLPQALEKALKELNLSEEGDASRWQNEWKDKSNRSPNPFAQKLWNFLKTRKKETLLDVGCGDGRDALFFAKQGLTVTAIDFSGSGIAVLRSHDPHIAAKVMDLREMSFPDVSFDVIYAHLSLHYFDHATTEKIISNIHRMLRKRGCFALKCKSVHDPLYGQGEKIGEDMFRLKHTRHFFSLSYAENLLREFIVHSLEETTDSYDGKISCFVEAIAEKKA